MNDARSPRDWLRERHAQATPELDARRRQALPKTAITWSEFVHELIHPNRFAWGTLVVVWVGLVVFRAVGTAPLPSHHPENPPPPAVLAAWIHQLKSHDAFAQIDRRP